MFRNSLLIYLLFRELNMNSLFFREIIIFLANLSCIHSLYREFIKNSLCSRFRFREFAVYVFKIPCFANPLWISYLFRELTVFSRIYFGFTIFLRIRYEFTIYLADSLWINLVFREVTMNSLSFSRKYHEFNICFVIALWIHYLFRDSTMNWLSVPGIHYLLRLYTMNSLSLFVSRIHYLFREFHLLRNDNVKQRQ